MVGHRQTQLCLVPDSGPWMHKPHTPVFSVVSTLLREKEQVNLASDLLGKKRSRILCTCTDLHELRCRVNVIMGNVSVPENGHSHQKPHERDQGLILVAVDLKGRRLQSHDNLVISGSGR